MKIHEYQAKQLLAAAGVPVPKGVVARTPDEAASAFSQLGTSVVVVKSQIHAGGRGKGLGFRWLCQEGNGSVGQAATQAHRCYTPARGPSMVGGGALYNLRIAIQRFDQRTNDSRREAADNGMR
jgi:hypothetical protein